MDDVWPTVRKLRLVALTLIHVDRIAFLENAVKVVVLWFNKVSSQYIDEIIY